ncbi:MAG: chromosome segregation protein SMC, partial [Methylobacter sp.]|nr:chromosome segregation protein SMC [Methylobacter sp.]
AFLNALDNERMDILEKIISTDIYADYKNEILQKAADAQQRLDYLKQDLAVIPAMAPEQLEASEHDLADFIDQAAELQEEQNNLKQQQASLDNVLTLQSRIADRENALQHTQALAADERQKLDKLTKAQDALLHKDDVQAIKEKNHALHQDKATLADFQGELKQIQEHIGADTSAPAVLPHKSVTEQGQTLSEIRSQIGMLTAQRQSESDLSQALDSQINEKTSSLANASKWLEDHVADESLLASFPETGRLKTIRAELAELKEKQKAFARWSKDTTAALKNNQSAIAQENKRITELKRKLPLAEKALNELAQGKNLAELEDFRQELQERVKDFRELYNLATANQKLTQGDFAFFGIFGHKEQPNHDLNELEPEFDALQQEISREENIKLALETAVFRESLLKKMTADRQHLVDGEPCFLCGALDHPYAKQPPKEANSQQALTDQKAKIKLLMTASGKLSQQIKAVKKQAEKNQANQTEL